MFDPNELPNLREAIRDCTVGDKHLLDDICGEVRKIKPEVRSIKPRSTTSVSIVASDGGNNKLVYDPFHVQLVRVVDSYGNPLCVDAITPTTDIDVLSKRQFHEDGRPRTALGQVMADLIVEPSKRTLNELSHMIPSAENVKKSPYEVSPSWVLVYRDLCEWAALYELICHKKFATDTLLVRDGLLRSKLYRGEYFIRFRQQIENSIDRIYRENRRKVFLVGLAKHSKVLARYSLAMSVEGVLHPGEPRYVRIPRAMEAKAYVWPEYARGEETEGSGGEAPKFVGGDMFCVRFGSRSGDPIWTVDILSKQRTQAAEVLAYLLADAIDGFPIPFYPRCLQKAHEHASVVDFDLEILQNEIIDAVRSMLPDNQRQILDAMSLQEDVTGRRYE
ncbi:hypothetical protein HZA56_05545 [Candidatus Poribacteria bacterium]|nr:hypothetical protein [Candidatus Poribacteria bacterium]